MPQLHPAPLVSLVDIDSTVGGPVADLLKANGFQVQDFSEPEVFLSYAARHVIGVAVLDIWIPRMTPIDLLAYLGARCPETRAIFIVAWEDRAAEPRLMSEGAFAFFLKPLNNEEFLDAVRRAFDVDAAIDEAAGFGLSRYYAPLKPFSILRKMKPRTRRQTYPGGRAEVLARVQHDRAR